MERWERPNCWMALSADQGSSRVRWQRLRLFWTLQGAAQTQLRRLPDKGAAEAAFDNPLAPAGSLRYKVPDINDHGQAH